MSELAFLTELQALLAKYKKGESSKTSNKVLAIFLANVITSFTQAVNQRK